MLKAANPISVTNIKKDQSQEARQRPVSQRLFRSYNAYKEGFLKGCRELIGLDGCYLKRPHQGTLLITCGLDGDNHYFPIAFAMVGEESKDN